MICNLRISKYDVTNIRKDDECFVSKNTKLKLQTLIIYMYTGGIYMHDIRPEIGYKSKFYLHIISIFFV